MNLPTTPGLKPAPSLLRTVNGVRVGVLGVVDPAVASSLSVKADEPIAAARREAARLRQAGAEVVIALAPVDRPVARRLAREAGVDFVVLGRQVGAGAPRADAVGRAFILAPATSSSASVASTSSCARAARPACSSTPAAPRPRRCARPSYARPRAHRRGPRGVGPRQRGRRSHLRRREEARARRARRRARTSGAAPWVAPATGSYFTNRLIALSRSLPRDPKSRPPCARSTRRSAR